MDNFAKILGRRYPGLKAAMDAFDLSVDSSSATLREKEAIKDAMSSALTAYSQEIDTMLLRANGERV